MIAHQGHLYPVYISHAQLPSNFAVTVIGDPDAPPGDAQVHVVYPDSARAIGVQDYVMLLRCFAAHLLAHAAEYERAQAGAYEIIEQIDNFLVVSQSAWFA